MDVSRFYMKLVLLLATLVVLSSQAEQSNDVTEYECPIVDIPTTTKEGKTVHHLERAAKCSNGRGLPGCCITRFYCNYNTTGIDLSMYGPPGFKMPCANGDTCCPLGYLLPISISINDDNSSNDDSD